MGGFGNQGPAQHAAAEAWHEAFGAARQRRDPSAAAGSFLDDVHRRDVLAFTWRLQTVSGAPSIE
ncbi:MAG: hypothetical protein ICV73_20800 [Acetobacteraceae bacterium]|nr:hypothetical protein [Acetobacteraceae bacterium]